MRSVYGSERSPARKGKRVRPVEIGRQSVYYRIWRARGERDELGAIASRKRHALVQTGAVHIETVPATVVGADGTEQAHPTMRWADWYRIPVASGMTIADLQRFLASREIADGPYWGCGTEMKATGAGVDPTRKRLAADLRKRSAALDRYTMPAQLVGLGWTAEELATLASYKDDCPTDWAHSGQLWLTLCQRFALFPRVFNYVLDQFQREQLAPTLAYGACMRRAVILEGWIAEQAPKAPTVACKANVTTEVCQCADCKAIRGEV